MTDVSRVLVAGGSGLIGREVVALLKSRGCFVRTLSKDPRRAKVLESIAHEVRVADATRPLGLSGVCDGIDVVVSALGAPISPSSLARASYLETDLVANLALLDAARNAKVRRFVYVSVHSEPGYAQTRYRRAHAEFEDALRRSGLEWGIVRPTGVFGAFVEMLPMARLGLMPLIGDGSARSNPIHEKDVAGRVVSIALGASREATEDVGGPEILTRREIAELAFRAVGRKARFVKTPPAVMRLSARTIGLFNPRAGDFLDFIIPASLADCVAPGCGELTLGPYLAAKAT